MIGTIPAAKAPNKHHLQRQTMQHQRVQTSLGRQTMQHHAPTQGEGRTRARSLDRRRQATGKDGGAAAAWRCGARGGMEGRRGGRRPLRASPLMADRAHGRPDPAPCCPHRGAARTARALGAAPPGCPHLHDCYMHEDLLYYRISQIMHLCGVDGGKEKVQSSTPPRQPPIVLLRACEDPSYK